MKLIYRLRILFMLLAAVLWTIFTPFLYLHSRVLTVLVVVPQLPLLIAHWVGRAKASKGEVTSLASKQLLEFKIISTPWSVVRSASGWVSFSYGLLYLFFFYYGFILTCWCTVFPLMPVILFLKYFLSPLWQGFRDWKAARGRLLERTRHMLLGSAVFMVDIYYEYSQGEWRETDSFQTARNRIFVTLDFASGQTWTLALWKAALSRVRSASRRSSQSVEALGRNALTSPYVPPIAKLFFSALVLIIDQVKDGLSERLVRAWTAHTTLAHGASSTVYDKDQDVKRRQNQHIYAPLPSSTTSIRILSIHPGGEGQPLSCSLHAESRHSAKYEALSYVWGDSTLNRFIFLDGTKCYVGKNLYECLVHLRHGNEQRELWVDALCINQADPDERSEQVLRMGDLYSKAERVIIWMGLEAPRTAEVFGHTADQRDALVAHGGSRPADSRNSDAIYYLLSNPWWSRVWTVQELILGHSTIVQCGKHSLSWEAFCQVIDSRLAHFHHGRTTPSDTAALLNTFYEQYLTLKRERQLHLRGVPRRYPLLERTYTFRGKQATVAVDKIFGFYGLLEDASAEIRPEYVRHGSIVQESFAIDFINRYKSLAVIALAELSTPDDDDSGSWEWFPRWCVSGKTSTKTLFWTGLGDEVAEQPWSEDAFDASGGRPVRSECRKVGHPYLYAIALEGWCVDIVVAVSPGAMSSLVLGRKGFARDQWLAVAQSSITDTSAHNGSRMQLFYKTITAGLWGQEQLPGSQDYVKYVTTVREACRGRRFFRTSSGHIGLGPQDVIPGDEVWVLLGMGVPAVLGRRSALSSRYSQPEQHREPSPDEPYRYIGQAYVDELIKFQNGKHVVGDPAEGHSGQLDISLKTAVLAL